MGQDGNSRKGVDAVSCEHESKQFENILSLIPSRQQDKCQKILQVIYL